MEVETDIPDELSEEISRMRKRFEITMEKMEIESLAFIEAAKQFACGWILREIKMAALSPESALFPENLRFDNKTPGELNLDLKGLTLKVSEIVETHLNRGDYWIHRNALSQPDISRDYLEFKKEKIRKELTSSVRIILGCASEIFWELEEEEPGNRAWVKEWGRRKYACFLRFSDEMTASLNRYFAMLEELFILDHEMKQEMLRIEGKKP